MRQLKLEAGAICYEERGNGPALLLIHSFPHDHRVWQAQADALADQFRVITPDLPGFGVSPPMNDFTIESAATLLLRMIDALQLQRVVVGGISMGGYITLAIAKRRSPKIAGLILADTKAASDTPDARQKRSDSIELIRCDGASHVINQMLPAQLAPDTAKTQPLVASSLHAIMATQSPAALTAGMAALRDRADYSDVLSDIDVPTLLLYGQEDQITPAATATELAKSLKQATVRLIPGAGHISTLEQPARVADAMRDFLKTLSA